MTVSKNTGHSEPFMPQIALAGTHRQAPAAEEIGAAKPDDIIQTTVRLRRKKSLEPLVKNQQLSVAPLSRQDYTQQFGADEKDVQLVEQFAHAHNLSVAGISLARRSVMLRGTVEQLTAAFNVNIRYYKTDEGNIFHARTGDIHIPKELDGIVVGVFGLDNRPLARPMFHYAKRKGQFIAPADASSYNPNDVARAYDYPADADGTGQCIALIELGGGYRNADMKNYFSKLQLKQPVITAVAVDGGTNHPTTASSADGEVVLDIQVAGAVANGASIAVYFAPNTDQGFLDAITTALHDDRHKPSVISISWGAPESQWTEQAIKNFDDAFMSASVLGVTITAAAGDGGSSDRETDGKAHVDFPASSKWVLACGGTRLTASAETVWNNKDGWATGGGISDVFPVPDYQQKISLPGSVNDPSHKGRGVPDIAANADDQTGYNILVDGTWTVVGGTSAVAPLIAGLIALINQKQNKPVGYIHPKLYNAPSDVFKDITSGDNITATNGGYQAQKGWDACTGLGVPLGKISSIF